MMSSCRMVRNEVAATSWISASAPFRMSWVRQVGEVLDVRFRGMFDLQFYRFDVPELWEQPGERSQPGSDGPETAGC